MSWILLATDAQPVTRDEFVSGWGNLIFMGLFFLALIILGIWWLNRQA